MANFNFQGKIIRQFWGKLIRQSTIFMKLQVYKMLPGGGQFRHRNSKIVTFFRCVIRTG